MIGGQPFLGVCERVLLISTLYLVSDDETDDDYRPSGSTQSQGKKKRRASRVPSVGSVGPSRRVKLADIISGSMPVPPTLRDSSGNEYEPPVISASKTLESRYSFFFLCMALGILWMCGFVLLSILFLWLCTNCDVIVVDPGSQAEPATSEESDVFVCDPSQETPAAESEAVSVLPDSGARFERRQHYRPAVGLEPSTIHNEWEKGMCIWFVSFHTLVLVVLLLDVICHSPVRRGGFFIC